MDKNLKKHNKGKFSVDKIWKSKSDLSYSPSTYVASIYFKNYGKEPENEYDDNDYEQELELVDEDESKRIFNWKPTESQKLLYLYGKYPDNWAKISQALPNHSPEDWQKHYVKISFTSREGKWTDEETQQLRALHKRFGKNWKLIASKIPGRTPEQVKDKIKNLNKKVIPIIESSDTIKESSRQILKFTYLKIRH